MDSGEVQRHLGQSYEGRLELVDSGGAVLLVIRGIVQDVDAPLWDAESNEPLRRPAIGFDPAGDTVIVRLAEDAHLRVGTWRRRMWRCRAPGTSNLPANLHSTHRNPTVRTERSGNESGGGEWRDRQRRQARMRPRRVEARSLSLEAR
jgi:hypothetical protein